MSTIAVGRCKEVSERRCEPSYSRPVDTSPIPLELVLSGRDLTEPRLSPDGSSLAFVQRVGRSTAVMVIDGLDDGRPEPERPISLGPDPAPGRGLGGGCFAWLPDGAGIVHAAIDGELWRTSGASVDRLTTHGRSCRAPEVGEIAGGVVVVYVVDEAEVWITSLLTGASHRLDAGDHEFCSDPTIAPDGHVVSWQAWSPPDMPWDGAERVDAELGRPERGAGLDARRVTSWRPDGAAVQQPRFAPDGVPACVHDASGWLRLQIGDREIDVGEAEVAGPSWGARQRSYAIAADGTVVMARNRRGFGSLVSLGDDRATLEVIDDRFAYGQLSIVGDRLVALRSGPSTPTEIVSFERRGTGFGHPTVLAHSGVAAWDSVGVPRPDAVTAHRDGVTLHARRYAAGHGRVLCWIHGGPTDQWQVDFRPRIAYWWSRGWDVLVVDPRGTTGHGRDYQRGLNGGWGRIDVDDAAALIRAAQQAGWSTPSTTVAIGGSSGGLTVLGLLADHSDLVAGGITSYPVSDLADLANATHRFEAHYTDTLVGPRDDDERFRRLSPLHRAERIRGPLLVFHGSDDPVVPVAQSEVLADRIRSTGGDVEFVVYEGEGHGFRDAVNQRDEYERTERFLESF